MFVIKTRKVVETSQDKPGRKKLSKTTTDKARRKKIEGDLDKLWAQIVKAQWKNKCGWPGCQYTSALSSHHFYHKAHGLRARWNLDNGIVLDFFHHIQKVHRNGDTEPIRDAIIQQIGNDRFEQLKIDVQGIWKPTCDELSRLKEDFQAILDDIILKETGV
jgi:hypothetical protein